MGNESVSITGNSAENGGGANVMGRLNVQNNTEVVFDNNTATGNGGALATSGGNNGVTMAKGNAVISDNTSVTFSNNKAANGGAIYAINLTMEDNGKVDITGNTAAKGAAIYAGSEAIPASQEGYYYTATAQVAIKNNDEVNISGNTATGTDVIFFQGEKFALSGNGAVTISGNTVNSASGYVMHNADPYFKIAGTDSYMYADGRVMEIARNDKVTFSGNTAKYDIYNESTLYLSADKGQTITFQHGFKNSPAATRPFEVDGGTTYLGKDASGVVSEGGTYIFADNGRSVTLETTVATVKVDGGMVYDGSTLEVTKTDFGGNNLKLVLDNSSVKLTDVAFVDAAVINVDFGYYEAMNKLTMSNVTGNNVSLGLTLDLTQETQGRSQAPLTMSDAELRLMGDLEDVTTITLSKFLDAAKKQFALSLDIEGWLGEGSKLVVDKSGFDIADSAITAKGYQYDRTEGEYVYYYALPEALIPEPSTATLSLLALAGLAARRRRKAA